MGIPSTPPQDLVVALICEKLHKLPSEVMAEDYGHMMRTWALIGEMERIRKQG